MANGHFMLNVQHVYGMRMLSTYYYWRQSKTIVVHCRKGERLQTVGSSVCSPATTLTGMFMQGSSCIFSIFQGCLYKNITIKNIQARFLQGKKSSGQRYDKTKPNNHTEIALRSPQEASSIVPLFHSVGSISANLLFFTKLNSHSVINIVMMIKLGGGPIRSPNDLSQHLRIRLCA